MQKGFTLIELLIVIGIIGVLAAVVLVGIDPVDKINAANDAKVIRDINALATAMESYAVTHNGQYPPGACNNLQQVLVDSGDLKAILKPPSGYISYPNHPTCSNDYWVFAWDGAPPYQAVAHEQLKSKKYTSKWGAGNAYWNYCSLRGKAQDTDAVGGCPP